MSDTEPTDGDASEAGTAASAAAETTSGAETAPKMGPDGFPLETPWREMQPEQQVAYFRHVNKENERKLAEARREAAALKPKAEQFDALDEASKTEAQREIDRLKAENEQIKAAQAEAVRGFGLDLAEQKLAAVAPDKGLDLAGMKRIAGSLERFLNADGKLDEDALQDFLTIIPDRGEGGHQAPAPRNGLGGGQRKAPIVSDYERGRAEAQERVKRTQAVAP